MLAKSAVRLPKSVFTESYSALLETLVSTRKGAGLTQVQVARRLGKPQPFLSYIESGERRIDVIEFCALARALDRDPTDLFREVASRLPKNIEI